MGECFLRNCSSGSQHQPAFDDTAAAHATEQQNTHANTAPTPPPEGTIRRSVPIILSPRGAALLKEPFFCSVTLVKLSSAQLSPTD
uniref:Uncharacterized protein n=1 Tax=Globodera rostochiensis TaxID=31243 RepID=A0A914HF72_GLORO